jgi:hypothetical protein
MSQQTAFKVCQVLGALFMAAGVTSCQLRADQYTSVLFLAGAVLFSVGRLAAWFNRR